MKTSDYLSFWIDSIFSFALFSNLFSIICIDTAIIKKTNIKIPLNKVRLNQKIIAEYINKIKNTIKAIVRTMNVIFFKYVSFVIKRIKTQFNNFLIIICINFFVSY